MKIRTHLSVLVCSAVCVLPISIFAQAGEVKLQSELFEGLDAMEWGATPEAFPEWQEVKMEFRTQEHLKLRIPARAIVERLSSERSATEPRVVRISFDKMDISISRSTSYFKLIYNVSVSLGLRGEERVKWFSSASFPGRRSAGFLETEDAQREIAYAVVKCLEDIGRTGGFRR